MLCLGVSEQTICQRKKLTRMSGMTKERKLNGMAQFMLKNHQKGFLGC